MSELVHLRDGDVVLYKRGSSPCWQARFRIDGEWRRISTRTSDVADAKRYAAEQFDKHRFARTNATSSPLDPTLGKAIEAAVNDLEEQIKNQNNKPIDHTHLRIIRRWVEPFFKDVKAGELDAVKVLEWYDWKKRHHGTEFAKSTLNAHNVALRIVFRKAVFMRLITEGNLPVLTTKRMGRKQQVRGAFDVQEYRILRRTLSKFVTEKTAENNSLQTQQIRQLLYYYCLIIANSGMRPGTEANNLRWRNVSNYRPQNDKHTYTLLRVKGKKGSTRNCIARHCVRDYLDRLKAWQEREGVKRTQDDFVFRLPDRSKPASLARAFQQVLEHADLKYDDNGSVRTLYSLRHTYATFRILYANVDYPTLAKNMGTSILMLEKHYSHLEPLRVPDRLA